VRVTLAPDPNPSLYLQANADTNPDGVFAQSADHILINAEAVYHEGEVSTVRKPEAGRSSRRSGRASIRQQSILLRLRGAVQAPRADARRRGRLDKPRAALQLWDQTGPPCSSVRL
jgi:hypothetical protein